MSRARRQAGRRVSGPGGFTLLELLMALAMLASGALVAFATVRAAGAVSTRGQLQARQQEQVRISANLLRRQLARAEPVAFAQDPRSRRPLAFTGTAQHMRFVAVVPGYLGGRAHIHEWGIAASEGGTQLNLTLWPLAPAAPGTAPRATASEVVAWPLASARFRYRGLDPVSGRAGPWQDQWTDPSRLPYMVALEAVGVDGRPWPPVWIAPLRGGARVEVQR